MRSPELLEHLHLADEIAAAFASFFIAFVVVLIALAQAVADNFHIGDEADELLVEFGAAIHHVAHVAGLALLLPEHIDDANDIEQRGRTHEQNSLLVGVGPEFAVRLQGHQERRLDRHEHHDEVGCFELRAAGGIRPWPGRQCVPRTLAMCSFSAALRSSSVAALTQSV